VKKEKIAYPRLCLVYEPDEEIWRTKGWCYATIETEENTFYDFEFLTRYQGFRQRPASLSPQSIGGKNKKQILSYWVQENTVYLEEISLFVLRSVVEDLYNKGYFEMFAGYSLDDERRANLFYTWVV
jgi:hypothetical protein